MSLEYTENAILLSNTLTILYSINFATTDKFQGSVSSDNLNWSNTSHLFIVFQSQHTKFSKWKELL